MNFILDFVSTLFLCVCQVYCWYNIAKEKFKFSIQNILKIIFLAIILIVDHYYLNNFIKGFVNFLLVILFCKSIIKLDLKRAILLSFVGQLIIILIESVVIMILILIFKLDANYIASSLIYTIIIDVLISLISVIISKFSFVRKFYLLLIKLTDKIKWQQKEEHMHLPRVVWESVFDQVSDRYRKERQ